MRDFRLIILMLVLVVTPQVAAAQSLTPREQLQQYVAELRRNPADDALREKIIKLAQELKPSPAIPEEARRHYVRADALRSDAKSPHDADAAAEEYQQALLEAPWWPDAYRDLGVALEVATRYEEAKKALNLYLLCHPSEDETRKAQDEIYRIGAKQEKLAKEQGRLAEQKRAQQEARQALERQFSYILGTWHFHFWWMVDTDGSMDFRLSDDGTVIDSIVMSVKRSDGSTLASNWPHLRGTISGSSLSWGMDEGSLEDARRFHTCVYGWQPVRMRRGSGENNFSIDRPTYDGHCNQVDALTIEFRR